MKQIASHAGLNLKQIKVWFLRKRLKHKIQLQKKSINKTEIILLNEFNKNKFLDRSRMMKLSKATNLPCKSIYNWFCEKRGKKLNKTNTKINTELCNNKLKKKSKFSDQDLKILNDEFEKNMHPSEEESIKIAKKVNLTKHQVITWFSNKRSYNNQKMNTNARKKKIDDQLLIILNKEYEKNNYPNRVTLDQIAEKTNLTTKQIYTWFVNKRTKLNQINPDRFNEKRLSEKKREYLYAQFEANKNPDKETIQTIASELNTSCRKIYFWFINKRKSL